MMPKSLTHWLGIYAEASYMKVFLAILSGLSIKYNTEIPIAIVETIFDKRLILGEDILKGILESQEPLTLIHLLVADYFWKRQDEGVTVGFEFPQQEFEATVNVFRDHLQAYGTSKVGIMNLRSHIIQQSKRLEEAMVTRSNIVIEILISLELDEREMLGKSLLELSSQSFIDLRQGNFKSRLKNLMIKIWSKILSNPALLFKAQAIFLEQIDMLEIDATIIKKQAPFPVDISKYLNGLILSCVALTPIDREWLGRLILDFYSVERKGSPLKVNSQLLMFVSESVSKPRK